MTRLALIGIAAVGLSAALAAAHAGLIAQLVGGLALVPLSLAAFIRLLPPPPWTEGGGDGWSDGRGGRGDAPSPPDQPPSDFDWDEFERRFRAYIVEVPGGVAGTE